MQPHTCEHNITISAFGCLVPENTYDLIPDFTDLCVTSKQHRDYTQTYKYTESEINIKTETTVSDKCLAATVLNMTDRQTDIVTHAEHMICGITPV